MKLLLALACAAGIYKVEVVRSPIGKIELKNRGIVFKDYKDSYAKECSMKGRCRPATLSVRIRLS